MNKKLYRKSRIYRWLILSLTEREEWRRHRKCLLVEIKCLRIAMDYEWESIHNEPDKHKAVDLMAEYMNTWQRHHECVKQYKLTNYLKYIYL